MPVAHHDGAVDNDGVHVGGGGGEDDLVGFDTRRADGVEPHRDEVGAGARLEPTGVGPARCSRARSSPHAARRWRICHAATRSAVRPARGRALPRTDRSRRAGRCRGSAPLPRRRACGPARPRPRGRARSSGTCRPWFPPSRAARRPPRSGGSRAPRWCGRPTPRHRRAARSGCGRRPRGTPRSRPAARTGGRAAAPVERRRLRTRPPGRHAPSGWPSRPPSRPRRAAHRPARPTPAACRR